MDISYDPEVRICHIAVRPGVEAARTVIARPEVLIDYDEHDNVVGIELFNVLAFELSPFDSAYPANRRDELVKTFLDAMKPDEIVRYLAARNREE